MGEAAASMLGPPGRCVTGQSAYVFFDSLAAQANGDVCVATIVNGGVTTISPAGVSAHVAPPDPW